MDDIFRAAIEVLLQKGRPVPPITDPTSPHSGFGTGGSRTIEVLNWQVTTGAIRQRLLANRERNAWLDQAIGMALWNLKARNSLDEVAFYNPNAVRFSDDGGTVRAPWGLRMLGGDLDSSFSRVLRLLTVDPSTLRAVVPVFDPRDVAVVSRDVPCLLAIHFTRRDGRLNATCVLRSLNPYWVWPYDHFFLTILLELASLRLETEPGLLTYLVSSLQVPEPELPRLHRALQAPPEAVPAMPAMTPRTSAAVERELGPAEDRLRNLLRGGEPSVIAPEEWDAVLQISDPWCRELLQALAYAFAARRSGAWPRLPFPCPEWASLLVDRSTRSLPAKGGSR